MNRDFLKEAIADAKAVKESAIANAKAALEEAFSPQLQAMFAQKLEEMDKEEMDEEVELEETVAEASENEMEESIEEAKDDMDEAYDVDEEMDLDEILAELEKDEMSEGEEEIKEVEEKVEEAEEEVEAEEEETETEEGDEDEEIDLEDMSEEDLKKFIEDVIEDMVSAGELEAGESFEDDVDVEVDADGEIEVEDDEMTSVDMAEGKDKDKAKKEVEEVVNTELEEALETIATLRAELNEINLLNAKLLYSNKIFKSKNMTESQKAKVLGAFDKATTVSEAKVVFETINENFTPTKKPVNENVIGSASKATGLVKEAKQPIVESDAMVSRFKKLAGII